MIEALGYSFLMTVLATTVVFVILMVIMATTYVIDNWPEYKYGITGIVVFLLLWAVLLFFLVAARAAAKPTVVKAEVENNV